MMLLLSLLVITQVNPPARNEADEPAVGAYVSNAADVAKAKDKKTLKLPTKEGVLVLGVRNYFPAQVSGMRPMDVLTSISGKRVNTIDDFDKLVSEMKVGQKYKVNVRRLVNNGDVSKWRVVTLTVKPVSRLDACLAAMKREKDEVQKIEFMQHRDSPETLNKRSEAFLYFVMQNGKPQGLRLKIQYVATDWLFIQQFLFRYGTETLEIRPKINEIERDNGIVGGEHRVWEWYDSQVPPGQLPRWKLLSRSSDAMLRLEGRQYVKDRELDLDEVDRMAVVLDAFRFLGGE